VIHRVPPDRQTFAYFRSRCYSEGLSKALVTRSVGTQTGLASERAYSTVTLPLGVLHGLRRALRGGPRAGVARGRQRECSEQRGRLHCPHVCEPGGPPGDGALPGGARGRPCKRRAD
jgi:hypothetical protein